MNNLTIFIPASIADIGNAIMRGLDPDTGGAQTFGQPNFTKGGADWIATTIPDCMPLAPNAAWWLADPTELLAYLTADYAARWPDDVCPTLVDIQTFADAAIAVSDTAIGEVAERFGLTAL